MQEAVLAQTPGLQALLLAGRHKSDSCCLRKQRIAPSDRRKQDTNFSDQDSNHEEVKQLHTEVKRFGGTLG